MHAKKVQKFVDNLNLHVSARLRTFSPGSVVDNKPAC